MLSASEERFALQVRVMHLPAPEREFLFHPTRRWKIDFAWPDREIAVEIEGGTYSGGRHVRPEGFELDCEKYNALAERGWRLFRFTSKMVKDGRAIDQIGRVLE